MTPVEVIPFSRSQGDVKLKCEYFCNLGSHVAQLVGCWTYNPRQLVGCWTYNLRVMGSIPSDANCFMWDNILGQDVYLVCASLHPGEIWVPSFKGYWLLRLAWQQ